jgi:hypothetical protein
MLYDRQETVADFLDDVTCVRAIKDLIDWCGTDPLLRRIADTRNVFLVGHSRYITTLWLLISVSFVYVPEGILKL